MRTEIQKIKDFLAFPLRALSIFEDDRWGLTSLKNERLEYVAKEVKGSCLDIGCGRNNALIRKFLKNNGVGIDVFKYEGLSDENIVEDMTRLPFQNGSFETATFIANLNHVPKDIRDAELSEAYRCLKSGGKIIITMPSPIPGILAHQTVHIYDKIFGTHYDVDSIRGMHEHESYYLTDDEIISRMTRAGFKSIRKKYFWTQWWLNHMFIGWKK